MMDTLEHIVQKWNLNLRQPSPINIEPVSRKIMAETLAELGFTRGAEIGVAAGDHSKLLLETIPNLELYCVDTWRRSSDYWSFRGSTLANWEQQAREKLAPYPGAHILQMLSQEAAGKVAKESLDFVYIDGGHDFMNIALDLALWSKRVRPGGIVYGHDYTLKFTDQYACHVKYVVDAYMLSYKIAPWFVLGESRRPQRRPAEDIPEWMYVK